MKEFNLTEYLKNPNQKVVTRDGRSVRIVCSDLKQDFPIVALIYDEEKQKENIECFFENGKYLFFDVDSPLDLFFAPVKKEGWVNIYDITRTNCISRIYKTKEEAETIGKGCKSGYITTTKIEWEE